MGWEGRVEGMVWVVMGKVEGKGVEKRGSVGFEGRVVGMVWVVRDGWRGRCW